MQKQLGCIIVLDLVGLCSQHLLEETQLGSWYPQDDDESKQVSLWCYLTCSLPQCPSSTGNHWHVAKHENICKLKKKSLPPKYEYDCKTETNNILSVSLSNFVFFTSKKLMMSTVICQKSYHS